VKTTLLILFLTGCGLLAQTPSGGDSSDSTVQDEMLRRALRNAMGTEDQPATATNSAAAVAAPTNAVVPAAAPAPAPGSPSMAVAPQGPAPANAFNPAGAVNAPAVPPLPAAPVMPSAPAQTAPASAGSAPETAPTFPTFPPRARRTPLPYPGLNQPASPFSAVPSAMPVPGLGAQLPPPAAAQPFPNPVAPPPFIPPSAAPPQNRPPEQIIGAGEINFPATDIGQVLDIYADLVGRTILRASNLPSTPITLKTRTPLTKTEAIEALDTVLAMNGITMINVGDKFVKAVPVGQAFQEAQKVSTMDGGLLPEADQYVTHIVQVKYAKPSELVPILQGFAKIPNSVMAIDSSSMLVIRDYSSNVKRMLELLDKIDVSTPLEYKCEVIPIKYALAEDIASALGSLGGGTTGGIGQSAGGARTGTTGINGSTTSPFGTPGATPGYSQPGTGLGGGTGGLGGLGGQRTTSFGDRLRSIVNRATQGGDFQILGQTKIIPDERTNSLLVFAGDQDMQMITNIIAKLDVVLAQVLIEAAIIEVTLSDNRSIGVSVAQTKPTTAGPGQYFRGIGASDNGSFLSPNSFSSFVNGATNAATGLSQGLNYFGSFGQDFQATVNALEDDSRVKVLSRPTIQTSHAVPASLQIGNTVPYITGTYFNGVNGTPESQYQQTFVGINLQVTPLINPDGLVVMDITQDVQQLGTPTTIDGNSVPTTTKRTAQAKVSVKDGDTIMLGGFISSTKTTDKAGVPLLKDIPVLGYLFRSTADTYQRTELIVLIRPTVLPTPESAALNVAHEEHRMPLVKQVMADEKVEQRREERQSDMTDVQTNKPTTVAPITIYPQQ
jgi:general secretion pathway protein D